MSERDELARLMYVADNANQPEAEALKDWGAYLAGATRDVYTHRMADAILAAGYRKPRIITTTEELDGLALESVVKSAEGNVWECLVGGWFETASRSCHVASDLALPATVLYEPTA